MGCVCVCVRTQSLKTGHLRDPCKLPMARGEGQEKTHVASQALNKLELLEVVELHGNKLVGDMPQGVCSSVVNSDYEYKSLTSDCLKEVGCERSCCTQCF